MSKRFVNWAKERLEKPEKLMKQPVAFFPPSRSSTPENNNDAHHDTATSRRTPHALAASIIQRARRQADTGVSSASRTCMMRVERRNRCHRAAGATTPSTRSGRRRACLLPSRYRSTRALSSHPSLSLVLALTLMLHSALHLTTAFASPSSAHTTEVAFVGDASSHAGGGVRLTPIRHWWFLGPFPVGKTELDGMGYTHVHTHPIAFTTR